MLYSLPWHSTVSPGAQLRPWRFALSPGTLLCPLALCSVPLLSAWPPGEVLGKLGQAPEEGQAVCDPVNSTLHR